MTTPSPKPALPTATKSRSAVNWGRIILGIALLVVVMRVFGLVTNYRIPTSGMAPTLDREDQLCAHSFAYQFGDPKRGDVVIFKSDQLTKDNIQYTYVMRVAALPGETVEIKDGSLLIDGQPTVIRNVEGEISYTNIPGQSWGSGPHQVPAESYFLLGDNTGHSFDSRYWGFLPRSSITGRAAFRYWPPSRIGSVN